MNPAPTPDGWRSPLAAAVRALRLGQEGEGSEQLTRFIDRLAPALGALPAPQLTALNGALEAILQGQGRKDFLLVADLLEYEVAPFLEQCLG
jgi:hypothetical protein